MTEHLHYITHTHDGGYGIRTEFTCTGDRTSPCHQYPPEDAEVETWGEADRALFVAHDDCWMKSWMEDAGCAETCCPDGEPVRSGPITVTSNGDCLEWDYAEPAVTPEVPERIEEWPEDDTALRKHKWRDEYGEVWRHGSNSHVEGWTRGYLFQDKPLCGPWDRVTDG